MFAVWDDTHTYRLFFAESDPPSTLHFEIDLRAPLSVYEKWIRQNCLDKSGRPKDRASTQIIALVYDMVPSKKELMSVAGFFSNPDAALLTSEKDLNEWDLCTAWESNELWFNRLRQIAKENSTNGRVITKRGRTSQRRHGDAEVNSGVTAESCTLHTWS